ncbi:MAG: Xaa-Pro peptidase family protein [Desulfobacterales bacterium]|jgi:Xaa-Pro aminopeptidase|nr:Xaa-Pro peptidase family protein [Desulfobacterales bacterium]
MKHSDSDRVPAYEIENRINIIQQKLQKTAIGGLVVIQQVDLLYFSGTAQNGFLYIPATGDPLLMVKRYLPRAVKESSLKHILEIKSVKEVPERILDGYGTIPRTIGFELDVLPVREFNFYQTLFPDSLLVDGSALILETRMIKSVWEIEQMRKVAALSHKTFEFMRSVIRPGLSELEFAGMGEAFSRKCGHHGKIRMRDFQAQVYAGHVLSGENSAMLGLLESPASGAGTSAAFPCGPGWKQLKRNEPIFVDFASAFDGYHMDETRMFAIGAMPQKALDTTKASIEIHNAIIETLKPGMSAHEIFEFGLSVAQRAGYQESYLGPEGYKMTFVGHGIGMELVEPPVLARGKHILLAPGMTLAVEPKLVVKDEFMVGVESVFEVTETGTRLISEVPVEILIG